MSCAILILAGGASSRWGHPKALLPWGADCLVNHLANTALAAGGSPVLRVLGAHASAIAARPAPEGVRDVVNPLWARGMGSSIAIGLREAWQHAPSLRGVMILPCDLPLVTASHLDDCIQLVTQNPSCIVQSDYGDGSFGPPSAFGRDYFGELLALDNDEGGRRIIERHVEHRVRLHFPDGRWDLDSPDDLARLRAFMTTATTH